MRTWESYSDQELIEHYQHGITEAGAEIYTRYHPRVVKLCTRCLKSRDDGEDAAQEVFFKAIMQEKILTYRGEAQLWSWIRKIAVNECMAIYRKKKRTREIKFLNDEQFDWLDQCIPCDQPDPEQVFFKCEKTDQLLAMVGQLPEKYHAVIKTSCLEEHSYKETARVLGIPVRIVGVHLHRAKKILAKLFEENVNHSRQTLQVNMKQPGNLTYRIAW
ncbi:RNA polymerase sigma factor [bacterium]|nr:RNA polymerase sigma factor [bacterium]